MTGEIYAVIGLSGPEQLALFLSSGADLSREEGKVWEDRVMFHNER